MERNTIAFLIAGVALAICTVFFFNEWQQEKDKRISLEEDVAAAERQIEALNSNKEQTLNGIGSSFVQNLLTYRTDQGTEGTQRALKQTIGKAKDKLTEQPEGEQYGEFGVIEEDVSSVVNVKDTRYNKTGNDTAQVIVSFDQVVYVEGTKSTMMNEMTLQMQFKDGSWKIADFEIIQRL